MTLADLQAAIDAIPADKRETTKVYAYGPDPGVGENPAFRVNGTLYKPGVNQLFFAAASDDWHLREPRRRESN